MKLYIPILPPPRPHIVVETAYEPHKRATDGQNVTISKGLGFHGHIPITQ